MSVDVATYKAEFLAHYYEGRLRYERDHYEVSIKVDERVLLPAVRSAPKDALIVADGFSCRNQIMHGTDRHALHLAEVLLLAQREGQGPARDYPEVGYVDARPPAPSRRAVAAALTLGGLAVARGLIWLRRRRRADATFRGLWK